MYICSVSHAAMCLLAQLLILLAKLRAANCFSFILILYICNDCSACYYVPSGSCCLALAVLCSILHCHVLLNAGPAMCCLLAPTA